MGLKLQCYSLKAGFTEILSYARQLLLQLLTTFTIHNKLLVQSAFINFVVLGSAKDDSSVFGFHNCFEEIRRGNLIRLLTRPSKNRAAQTPLFLELSAVLNPQIRCRSYSSKAKRYPTAVSTSIRKRAAAQIEFVLAN